MKALVYHGSKDVRVDTVKDPVLQEPDDVILRVTATAICGSDLHLYRGKVPTLLAGDILGHEFMGEVVEAGAQVTELKRGDRVVVPFVIACGSCYFCSSRLFAACESTNPFDAPFESLYFLKGDDNKSLLEKGRGSQNSATAWGRPPFFESSR